MIQYVSDIHLEFYRSHDVISTQLIPVAPILILAGDIGHPFQDSYRLFIESMSQRFEHVILIHGNHEYYHRKKTMNEMVLQTRSICDRLPNVHFLHNDHVDLEVAGKMHRFIGSVLWSQLDDKHALVNDARCIREFSMDRFNDLFKQNLMYLDHALSESPHPVVVVTHHLPSHALIDPVFAGQPFNQCFASHVDWLIEKHHEHITVWIYGHTHIPQNTFVIHGVPCVTNPIGYPKEQANPCLTRVFDIK